jgi:hypothetical protein
MKTFNFFFALALLLVCSCKKDNGSFIQLYPANGSLNLSTTQTFGCTSYSGAVSYTFSLNDGSATITKTSTTDTVTISNLSSCDSYNWTVTATKADGSNVTIAPSWTCATGGGNNTPCLQAPANNSTGICIAPQFAWTPVAGVSTYNLTIANDSYMQNVVYGINISADNYTISNSILVPNAQYYWQVAASGYTSAVYSFTTVGPPLLSSPTNSAIGVSRATTLSWSAVPCVNSYTVDVSTTSNFGSTVLSQQSTGSSFTVPAGQLSAYTIYYWRVRVNDYTSNSPTWSFTTGL